MVTQILIPISPGELMDRISILKLKVSRSKNSFQIEKFSAELENLRTLAHQISNYESLTECVSRLDEVNTILWEVEDQLRNLEQKKDFGSDFVILARKVYQTNDRRSEIKRQINTLLGQMDPGEKVYFTAK